MDRDAEKPQSSSVEFFGVKLKVNNPRLAALLNSSVNEDVQVIGLRARDAFAGDSRAEFEDAHRVPRDEDDLRATEDRGQSEPVLGDGDEP
jgi:hypothetical protein